jgi:hypothetical protein
MKFKLPDSDDIVFISILGFHQISFLYYAQMNQNNYLRYINQSDYLCNIQRFIKKYSKGLSLLVKVNSKYLKNCFQLSFKIVEFLVRMQVTQYMKSYLT